MAVYCRRKCGFFSTLFSSGCHLTECQKIRDMLRVFRWRAGTTQRRYRIRPKKKWKFIEWAELAESKFWPKERRSVNDGSSRSIGCGCAGSGDSKPSLLLVETESESWTPTFSAWRFVYVEDSDKGQSMNGMCLALCQMSSV